MRLRRRTGFVVITVALLIAYAALLWAASHLGDMTVTGFLSDLVAAP